MIYNGQNRVDEIFLGDVEIGKVFKGDVLLWEPTEVPSEEEQFIPDEHHPIDPLFGDYYGWQIYLRVDAHNGNKVKFPQSGTWPAYVMGDVYPMVVYDYYGQDWESYTGLWDDTYRLSKDQVVEYGSSIPQDGIEILNLNPTRSFLPATPKIEGVGQGAWSISYINGRWNDGNKLLTELYIGDYAAEFGFELGHHAFYNSSKLKNIRLPRTLEIIDHDCFNGCSSLKIADLRNCELLDDVNGYAFANCTSLEKVILPRLKQIHYSSFQGCSSLQKIVLLAETPPSVVFDDDGLTMFLDIPENIVVKVKAESLLAYKEHPVWGHYEVAPYVEEDFTWTYEP